MKAASKPSALCVLWAIVATVTGGAETTCTFAQPQALLMMQKHAKALLGIDRPESDAQSVRIEDVWQKKAGTSESLPDLLKLTGMRNVKERMFQLNDKILLDEERGLDFKKDNFHIRFDGNPGTGKTTVARIYGKFLKEKGVLPEENFEETSGAKLVNGGTSELKKILEKLDKGGVLFIDEAYQLNPKTNPLGAQVLDYLLPEMENRRGSLIVVIAGYQKQMDDLMSFNEGLPSRFPYHFNFEDYNDEELFEIFKGIVIGDEGRFKFADEKFMRIAAKRLGQQRGIVGFGNARAVRNKYESAKAAQAERIVRQRDEGRAPDLFLIEREDILGPMCIDAKSCPALDELQSMRGLATVKKSIGGLLKLVQTNAQLEDQEKPLRQVTLNRIFVGNPGLLFNAHALSLNSFSC